VTKPVYLVMQVPTYLTEAKFYYMFQMSVLYLPRITHLGIKLLSSKWFHPEAVALRGLIKLYLFI
jgi:hypothetical protein